MLQHGVALAATGRSVQINLSARTLSDPAFLEAVERALRQHHAEPAAVAFEITETAIVADMAQAQRFAYRLAELGCRFALDDFGTHYGSLTYLKHLPVDYLKIDMEFVRDLTANPKSRAVVTAIVHLAHGFEARTLAEGVEDQGRCRRAGSSASPERYAGRLTSRRGALASRAGGGMRTRNHDGTVFHAAARTGSLSADPRSGARVAASRADSSSETSAENCARYVSWAV